MSRFDDYPYKVHTNNELKRMLSGDKPLSVFMVENFNGHDELTLSMSQSGQDFDTHVASGFLQLDEMRLTETRQKDGAKMVVDFYAYTLQGERWRAEAYFALARMMKQRHWCANLERLEGTLLGYSDEQNDYHIKRTFGGSCSGDIKASTPKKNAETSEEEEVLRIGERKFTLTPALRELYEIAENIQEQERREQQQELDQAIQNVIDQKERGERER